MAKYNTENRIWFGQQIRLTESPVFTSTQSVFPLDPSRQNDPSKLHTCSCYSCPVSAPWLMASEALHEQASVRTSRCGAHTCPVMQPCDSVLFAELHALSTQEPLLLLLLLPEATNLPSSQNPGGLPAIDSILDLPL